MIIPNLEKERAYWVERLNIADWKISLRYEPDPRDPMTDEPVYGYCMRQPDVPRADIVIRTPRTEADIAETLDTIVHELLHCRLAALEGPRTAEENAVWALAPLLTQLRLSDPPRAKILMKAIARPKTSLAAQSRARAERKAMDPEKLKAAIAAIEEGNGEAALAVLKDLLIAAAGGGAEPPAEPMPPKEGDPPAPPAAPVPADEEKPKMGLTKDEPNKSLKISVSAPSGVDGRQVAEQVMKQLQEQMASDRAAAVDGLLDTRPDLTPKQRAMLKEIGVEKGVAKARDALADLVPAPKPAEPKAATLPKLGLDKAPRGEAGGAAKVMPSSNEKVNTLFRVMPSDASNDGVEIPPDNSGVLVRFSVLGAYLKTKKAAENAREALRAKMGGTR